MRHLVLAALLACAVVPASAATIVNGSFETQGVGSFTGRTLLPAGSTALTGWKVDSGNIDLVSTYWNASNGRNSVDLNGTTRGSISTTILGMIVGRVYDITFDMAANPDSTPNTKVLSVASGLDQQSFLRQRAGSTRAAMNWATMLFSITATSVNQLLTFRSLSTGAAGAAIDNVRIALVPVPLPATAPLALAGLAALALIRRRKRA